MRAEKEQVVEDVSLGERVREKIRGLVAPSQFRRDAGAPECGAPPSVPVRPSAIREAPSHPYGFGGVTPLSGQHARKADILFHRRVCAHQRHDDRMRGIAVTRGEVSLCSLEAEVIGGLLRGRPSYYNWLTNAYHLLGRHDRELEVAAQARAHFPSNLAALRTELIALAALGRGQEVTARLREIDPLGPDPIRKKATVMREIALDLAAHGDSGSARIALARTLAWHASQPVAEQSTDYLRFERAETYYAAGHGDSAHAIVVTLVRAHPAVEEYVGLAGALAAQRRDTAEAVRLARRLADGARPDGRGRATFWRACIAAELGRRDEAVDLLARSLAEGYVFNDLFFLSAHLAPSFAAMRAYPPFQDLLRPKA